MFSKIIDQKASKLKFNVEGYLSNDRRRQQTQPQSQPVVKRENPVPSVPTNPPSIPPQPSIKQNQFDIKILNIQNKSYEKPGSMMRPIKKQKQIHIYYFEETSRFKIEIKVGPQNGFQVKRDSQKGMLEFQFKKAQKKKSFREQNSTQPKWMTMSQLKDQKIVIFMVNKQTVKNIHKNFFEGLLPEDQIKSFEDAKQGQQKIVTVPQPAQQDRGDDDVVKFTMPTEQQLNETQKFRKSIKDMKQDEKLYIITDIFKIKKEYEDLDRKKLKCPVYSCQKNYREISQLKTHLKKTHVELTKHGIELTQFGTFQYSFKALDLALYLGKIFPSEMKKIIKKMKTKQAVQ